MTFEELQGLVADILDDPGRSSVIYGCDCGCGGDSYTLDEWMEFCENARKAKTKLEGLGITFETFD